MCYTTQNGNGFFNYDVCKECKGARCCQHFGCFYAPEDFIVLRTGTYTEEQQLVILAELAKLGRLSIDMMTLKDRTYGPLNPETLKPDLQRIKNEEGCLFLRVRNAGREVNDFQYFMEEGNYFPCSQWSAERGCSFKEDERPFGGRMIEPRRYGNCVDHTDYTELMLKWLPHQEVLVKLSEKFDGVKLFSLS